MGFGIAFMINFGGVVRNQRAMEHFFVPWACFCEKRNETSQRQGHGRYHPPRPRPSPPSRYGECEIMTPGQAAGGDFPHPPGQAHFKALLFSRGQFHPGMLTDQRRDGLEMFKNPLVFSGTRYFRGQLFKFLWRQFSIQVAGKFQLIDIGRFAVFHSPSSMSEFNRSANIFRAWKRRDITVPSRHFNTAAISL